MPRSCPCWPPRWITPSRGRDSGRCWRWSDSACPRASWPPPGIAPGTRVRRPRNFFGRRALTHCCDRCSPSTSARTGCAGRHRISRSSHAFRIVNSVSPLATRHSPLRPASRVGGGPRSPTLLLCGGSSFLAALVLAPGGTHKNVLPLLAQRAGTIKHTSVEPPCSRSRVAGWPESSSPMRKF